MAKVHRNGFPRVKRRIDSSEEAKQWNKLRKGLMNLQESGVRNRSGSRTESFTHFRIHAQKEGSQWKGYVGRGFFACAEANAFQNLWHPKEIVGSSTEAVEHNGEEIQLDITALPWEDGIDDLIEAGAGINLTAGNYYYAYLKITSAPYNLIQTDITQETPISTLTIENVVDVETAFETTLQDVAAISPYTGNSTRWFLLGVVDVPATGNVVEIGQLHKEAIYLHPVYRGREVSTGLGESTGGSLINTGVTSATGGGGISVSPSDGDIVITDA